MISCKSSSSLINYYLCALFCDECSQRENTNTILAKLMRDRRREFFGRLGKKTYEELKYEFENSACRVDDVLLYPVLDTKNKRTLYTLLQLKERFLHLYTTSLYRINEMNKNIHKNYEDRMKGLITDISPIHPSTKLFPDN